jgi:hypothetical protein
LKSFIWIIYSFRTLEKQLSGAEYHRVNDGAKSLIGEFRPVALFGNCNRHGSIFWLFEEYESVYEVKYPDI